MATPGSCWCRCVPSGGITLLASESTGGKCNLPPPPPPLQAQRQHGASHPAATLSRCTSTLYLRIMAASIAWRCGLAPLARALPASGALRLPRPVRQAVRTLASAGGAPAVAKDPPASSPKSADSSPAPKVDLLALPTSDESPELLRIRHSVREGVLLAGWCRRRCRPACRQPAQRLLVFLPPCSAPTSWPWRCSGCTRARRCRGLGVGAAQQER